MQIIPTQAVPNQTLTAILANQICTINLRQTDFGLLGDLYVNNVPVVLGVLCENLNRWVRSVYLNFTGDICIQDTGGSADPDYTKLGSRFQLVYLEVTDLAAAGFAA